MEADRPVDGVASLVDTTSTLQHLPENVAHVCVQHDEVGRLEKRVGLTHEPLGCGVVTASRKGPSQRRSPPPLSVEVIR